MIKKYIKLVEQKDDIISGINAAIKRSEQHPNTRGGGEMFWVVCSPTGTEECFETIFLANTQFIMFMSRGTDANEIINQNYQMYSQANKENARKDAINRWMEFKKIK